MAEIIECKFDGMDDAADKDRDEKDVILGEVWHGFILFYLFYAYYSISVAKKSQNAF